MGHKHGFDPRQPGLQFVRQEVDPIEVFEYLDGQRQEIIENVKANSKGLLAMAERLESLDTLSFGNLQDNLHRFQRAVGQDGYMERKIKDLNKLEDAIRMLNGIVFKGIGPKRNGNGNARESYDPAFPLKINPFNPDVAAEVIKGCKAIERDKFYASARKNEARMETRQAEVHLTTQPAVFMRHRDNV